jgi:hypothetical protein
MESRATVSPIAHDGMALMPVQCTPIQHAPKKGGRMVTHDPNSMPFLARIHELNPTEKQVRKLAFALSF